MSRRAAEVSDPFGTVHRARIKQVGYCCVEKTECCVNQAALAPSRMCAETFARMLPTETRSTINVGIGNY